MRASFRIVFLIVISAAFPVAGAGQNTNVVTVCEVMANPNQYGNSVVALIGRLDVTGVILDRRNFVSQDNCDQPIRTNDYIWPAKILIWTQPEKGLPHPPADGPQIDHRMLAEKIGAMGKDTALGVRKEFRMDKEGNPADIVVKNQWVVAYGHTFYSPHLTTRENCKEFGCQGFNGQAPVVIVVDPKNVRTLNDDGSFYVSDKRTK